ncbi:AraC family transcriptional regulator [Actinospica durhamensis]|uniref:AraC family transcriptional regulator n=1 Tax=Actinospica durhamensis TaxID=1508375 RepID=A0A941EVW4_9ACTN|nr:helix-turn-helix domain-containing protein [Actinospica durhamensis]MBR7838231.1 AraC family transcriptional regulator [Actinospica durhamensis]
MMAKNRHAETGTIPTVPFFVRRGAPVGVEVMTLAELRSRVSPDRLRALPQRPDFHQLFRPASGPLGHTVDFTDYELDPDAWLWVRPGQVQQWGDISRAEGVLILFQPGFLDPATAASAHLDDPHAPVVRHPGPEDAQLLDRALDHLDREYHAPGSLALEHRTAVLRHLLAALVLRLAHLPDAAGVAWPAPDETYLRFRDAVEEGFARSRRGEDYAHLLGYSTRTLSRATAATDGLGAKEFIDRRVVLEARRLLAHTDQSAAQIAAHLGFATATHFTKYFHQRAGLTPTAFRASVHGEAAG